ncbi:PREDICTED: defensin-like protein 46 [Camelina sativa]|uniref:Defensin-like protein 46 n=1 Tax=Camelina sativa TaxID=90675 RepID=A0ABM0X3X0_CAMSA|nr:PREDICTED: defensin-like protein 46 [Camelina sativa]
MCSTKALVICFLVIILAVSLSNNNVLASDGRIKNFDVDHCDTRCYGKDECMNYCIQAGFRSGECGSLCIPCPIKCCCQK